MERDNRYMDHIPVPVLEIARRNAERAGVDILFLHTDIADPATLDRIGAGDTVIMNGAVRRPACVC